jgi:uncharacterized membrane protein
MRLWELDFVKGIAIILVVIVHIVFDLDIFTHACVNVDSWLWWTVARVAASLFILTSGVSLAITVHKAHSGKKLLYRSVRLFSLGMVITFVTAWLFNEGTILFGILHFLAVAPLFGYLLSTRIGLAVGISCGIFALTPYINNLTVNSHYLLWVGLIPADFCSFDFFPLVPWLGVYLLGVVMGKLIYPRGVGFTGNCSPVVWPIIYLGRYTLLIYMVHQPIILACLYSKEIISVISHSLTSFA